MSATNSICFTPLTIRGKVWKNRFVVAPMIGMEVENGALRPEALAQLRFYAQGGPAEYIVGETEVSPAAYRGPAHMAFDFHNEVSQTGMRDYARIVKDELGRWPSSSCVTPASPRTPGWARPFTARWAIPVQVTARRSSA